MTQDQFQDNVLKALSENSLTTGDRNWLFNLISKIMRPSIIDATTKNGAVTLAAGTSGEVARMNSNRWNLTIVNAGANPAYLNYSDNAAVDVTGSYLGANGGAISLGRGTDIPYSGEINAISAAGTTLVFVEFSVYPEEQIL
jgi:hypothetical protein